MEIKLCTEKDIQAVGRFYDVVVKHLTETINYPKWTYKEYPSEKSVRAMTEAGCQFMCIENDEVVGAFVFNDDPQGAYENADWSRELLKGEYMVCHALATSVSCRGKGVGGKMIEFCIEYAESRGYKAIRLDVVPDNYPAKKLYEKYGFEYRGDVDLKRGIKEIPEFSMYELNW
ncbi:MAG: GNAT family N-acetyltransferase [Lachnospiraceae bacterium]|nr:GNAT family N-acetyltransferase [Lachnospiraceae bacterium]